jgi:hypothetical protein
MVKKLDRRSFIAGVSAVAASALPLQGQATVRVVVDPQAPLGKLPRFGLGFSTEKHLIGIGDFYVPENRDFSGLCRRLGPQVLRVGGTHVDHTSWSPSGAGHKDGTVSASDIQRFAKYVQSLGWKVVYGVNLAHASPKESADEASCAAKSLGDSLLAFEIGNEPDLFVTHKDRGNGYNYNAFLAEWKQFAAVLKAVVPGAPLSGPGAFGDWRDYTLPFAHDVGDQIQMLTQHYYRMSGKKPEATLESLITGMPALFAEMQALVEAARSSRIPTGFRMIETNSFVAGGLDGVSDRAAAALWAVEYALRAAEIGVNGLNFQIGPRTHSNSSIEMGPGPRVTGLRPQFYGLVMIAEMGTGTMLRTTISGAPQRVSAFCLDEEAGQRSVVLNNMNDGAPLAVEIHSGTQSSNAQAMLLYGGSLASAACSLGGATLGNDGSGDVKWTPVQGKDGVFGVKLPPASAVRIRI